SHPLALLTSSIGASFRNSASIFPNLSRTRSQKLVREYRQRRNDRDRGWPHQARPPEPPRWLVQVSVRQKPARSIGPNATGASTSRSILPRTTSLALTAG